MKGEDPTRTQVSYGFPTVDPKSRRAVVGVINDVKYAALNLDPEPAMYLVEPQAQMFRRAIVVATSLAIIYR